MNFKTIKSFVRNVQINMGLDRFAARFLPSGKRHLCIPPYPYYRNSLRRYYCDGVRWEINPNRHTQHKILLGGCEDSIACAVRSFENFQKRGNAILDVGANTGGFSLPLAARLMRLGDFSIHSFEPQPHVFDRFERQLDLNPNLGPQIRPRNIGIGEVAGELALHVPSRSDGLASFQRNYAEEAVDTIHVPVTTLDDYSESENIHVAFIKIDVEGFEACVLKGAAKILAEHKPQVFCEMRSDECEAADILRAQGYFVAERFDQDILWRI